MGSFQTAWQVTAAFLIFLTSAFAGWRTQKVLPQAHRSRESVEAIRLVMTMLLTISALVLGLLTSSAKARYDDQTEKLEEYAADLIELDQRLLQYGAEVQPIRSLLRAYTAAAIADTWPMEKPPAGAYPMIRGSVVAASLESVKLGEMLADVDRMIEMLAPVDAFHQQTAARLRNRVADTLQKRWRLLASVHATLSWPFLAVLMFWLVIIFAIFGLSSPHNALVSVVIVLCALSVSSSIFLILDFDSPQSGLLSVPSQSMRNALWHMDNGVPHASG